ncbi:hypothetical protein [Hyphomicrobium sp. D-2]|uniref:hypothetical protein n=1 Tax=Hyphomicrobium sp. D-2 TaxID=3041621 RepID=UPI002453C98F|nr:hypothetical protein [Hyphomicrobium sp. D-2]MDH4980931.1 hypothetical protein [Hyphomicrobium sp. D-2]
MIEHPRIVLETLSIEALDMRPAQNEIRARYGRGYHLSDDCLRDVAALWGIGPEHECINSSGVFIPYERIELAKGRCRAEIRTVRTPSGLWAMDISYAAAICGGGASPSVWNGTAFFSEADARAAGLQALITRFRAIIAEGGSDASEARQLIALLEAERTPSLRCSKAKKFASCGPGAFAQERFTRSGARVCA